MVESEFVSDGLLVGCADPESSIEQLLWICVLTERDIVVPRVEAVFFGLRSFFLSSFLPQIPFLSKKLS